MLLFALTLIINTTVNVTENLQMKIDTCFPTGCYIGQCGLCSGRSGFRIWAGHHLWRSAAAEGGLCPHLCPAGGSGQLFVDGCTAGFHHRRLLNWPKPQEVHPALQHHGSQQQCYLAHQLLLCSSVWQDGRGFWCVYILDSCVRVGRSRGFLATLYESGITVGILGAYVVNYMLSDCATGWKWMFGLAVPTLIQLLSVSGIPSNIEESLHQREADKSLLCCGAPNHHLSLKQHEDKDHNWPQSGALSAVHGPAECSILRLHHFPFSGLSKWCLGHCWHLWA